MSARALDLLALGDDQESFILDIGCGSGLSGEIISERGHHWVGIDIKVAQEDREVDEDLILKDIGTGLPFRAGTFDGAISISAIQWLCHANANCENPRKRLLRFFQSLYACLGRGTRAVFQFYPENADQSELISNQAMRAGFNGGLVVDYPNSAKAKKIYLVLMTGGVQQLPRALISGNDTSSQVSNIARRGFSVGRSEGNKRIKGSKEWIEAKKERARKQGK
ncbi:unnamed protein product [Anisakis simplex]|uniref:Ribosome biogenesis methyltransferase WBSCR22 (inferred by orthology to a human protein) n=1 Tax=Anisakis simplex TaxID=6269 RepID=A0A0M3K3E7_ANISI|nr:unnamed protein product [Anisakis simplex]